MPQQDALHLARWTVTSGSNAQSRGAVVIEAGDHHWQASASGNGAVDALFGAVDKALAEVLAGHPRLVGFVVRIARRGSGRRGPGHGDDPAAGRGRGGPGRGRVLGRVDQHEHHRRLDRGLRRGPQQDARRGPLGRRRRIGGRRPDGDEGAGLTAAAPSTTSRSRSTTRPRGSSSRSARVPVRRPMRAVAYAGEPGAFAEDAVLVGVRRRRAPGRRELPRRLRRRGGRPGRRPACCRSRTSSTAPSARTYDLLLEHDLVDRRRGRRAGPALPRRAARPGARRHRARLLAHPGPRPGRGVPPDAAVDNCSRRTTRPAPAS